MWYNIFKEMLYHFFILQKEELMMKNKSVGLIVFKIVNTAALTVFALICILPLWHLLMLSLSTTEGLRTNTNCGFILWPLCDDDILSFEGFADLLRSGSFWTAIANSLFYIVVGGVLTVFLSYCAAYCIKRKGIFSKPFSLMLIIAFVFNAGIVPAYVVHKEIGLTENRLGLIMIGLMSIFYIAYILSVMKRLPQSLEDAAELDGAGAFTVLFKIIFPLTKYSAAAVLVICTVARWNDWLTPLIYSIERNIWPLQVRLHEYYWYMIDDGILNSATTEYYFEYYETVHKVWCMSVISALLPIALIYPLMKSIVKENITVGAIKG